MVNEAAFFTSGCTVCRVTAEEKKNRIADEEAADRRLGTSLIQLQSLTKSALRG
jgi:hypothetical protein